MRRPLLSLCFAFALAACGATSQAAGPPAAAIAAAPISASTAPPPSPAHDARSHRSKSHRPKAHRASSAGGLPYSTASGHVVQPQPAPGSCHATGHGLYSSPDRRCTPGALNPAVRQSTIDQTICVSGYTKTIRPSSSVTDREKLASMASYGDGGRSPHDFEYDHLVSLELGGAVNDPRNLWPEPGASPNPKDSVEGHLHTLVCDGQMTLAKAQHIIATGWISYAKAPPSTGPNKPISEINCSDFPTHAAAQQWFTAHGGSSSNDVAGLDGDHDGIACESLP